MKPSFAVELRQQLLVATFDTPHRLLSWSMNQPGFSTNLRVVWVEIRNRDFPLACDPQAVVAQRLAGAGVPGALALVTSRDVAKHHLAQRTVESESAWCLTTLGLSNGERVGHRIADPIKLPGTINTLLAVSRPLCDAAFVEAISIVTMARTTAILDAGARRGALSITGTGTDCIVVAAPMSGATADFAGMHTALGEAIGAAVYDATAESIPVWQTDYEAFLREKAAG